MKFERGKKWAVILGASSGFGAATAIELAKSGFNICGIHFDKRSAMPDVEKVKRKIRARRVKALYFNVNAADPKAMDNVLVALRKEAKGLRSPVHLLMHSLAFGSLVPLIGEEEKKGANKKQIDLTIDVMANTLVYWTQRLVNRKLMGRGGQIISMTSAGSHRVWYNYGVVSAAKAALESHTRQLALELASKKIAVNCIQAGVTKTPALLKIPTHKSMIEEGMRRNPFGRLTRPEDAARVINMLALHNGYWLTGSVIRVDGGEDVNG